MQEIISLQILGHKCILAHSDFKAEHQNGERHHLLSSPSSSSSQSSVSHYRQEKKLR